MRKLIVNADGFGFTFGNNRAILEVLEHGFIRSVSVNVTWPAVEEVTTLVRGFPHVSVGIHLNLSVGPPVLPASEIPSLVGPDGEFHGPAFRRLLARGRLDRDEMKKELRAQIAVLRDRGVRITHWDSHQGRHLYPGFFEAALEVACEEGILATRTHRYYVVFPRGGRLLRVAGYYLRRPARILTHALAARRMRQARRAGMRMPDRRLVLQGMGADAVYSPACWNVLLETLPEGLNFVECHPGYVDEDLRRYSRLTESRERERALFADQRWTGAAEQAGVEMTNYHELARDATHERADT